MGKKCGLWGFCFYLEIFFFYILDVYYNYSFINILYNNDNDFWLGFGKWSLFISFYFFLYCIYEYFCKLLRWGFYDKNDI